MLATLVARTEARKEIRAATSGGKARGSVAIGSSGCGGLMSLQARAAGSSSLVVTAKVRCGRWFLARGRWFLAGREGYVAARYRLRLWRESSSRIIVGSRFSIAD